MHRAPSYVPPPPHRRRLVWDRAAIVLAVVPTLVYLAGIPLHDSAPGTCDAWAGCTASDRDQWGWTAQPWATAGVMLAAFIAGAVRIAPWLRARPRAVRRAAITALCLLVPVTIGFGAITLLVWNTDCSEGSWLCFGGPSDALALGSPGAVTAAVSGVLVAGLTRGGRSRASALAANTITVLAAGLLAVVAGFAAGSLLSGIAASLGA